MKILLIFTLCLISDGGVAVEVTGYSGGGILIKCTYDTQYTQNKKYFCKDSAWTGCSDLIKTEDKDVWRNSGRFSLFDDTKSAEFRVMIRDLTVQDTGTYYCAVDIDFWRDIYTPVELIVKEDLTYKKSISETVHVGGNLNVICEYPESLMSNHKLVCKMKQECDVCSYKVSVNESSKYVKMGKFSLYDDRTKHIFSVSMRDISEEDSGVYWCGAEADWNSDHGYKVYFTQINVTLTGLHVSVSSLIPTQSLSSSAAPVLQTNKHKSDFTPAAPPTGSFTRFPASTVIPASVIALLFLIGTIALIVMLQKRCKMQGIVISGKSVQGVRNNQEVPLDVSVYENIRDTSHSSETGTSTVYASVKHPTIASDNLQSVYANTELM